MLAVKILSSKNHMDIAVKIQVKISTGPKRLQVSIHGGSGIVAPIDFATVPRSRWLKELPWKP